MQAPAPLTLRFDQGTLVLEGPVDAAVLGAAPGVVWAWDERVSRWRTESIHYAAVKKALDRTRPVAWRDEAAAFEALTFPGGQRHPLRANQRAAVEAWRTAGGRGLVVMPTGTGKTEVALEILSRLGRSALIVAPVRDLMYQWHRRLWKALGVDAGVLGDSRRDVRPITVTTYESAAIHMKDLGARFALVIWDEVHHLPGDFRRESALMALAPWRLGLTATPARVDGRHVDLDALVGPLVFEEHLASVRGRELADYEVVRIPVTLSEAEQTRYDEASFAVRSFIVAKREEDSAYDWKKVLADSGRDPAARAAKRALWLKQGIENRAQEKMRVLEDLFRLHQTDRVLVFAGSNASAIDVSLRFLVPAVLAHTPKEERLEVLDRFERGDWRALVANRVLDEGVDVPAARVAVVIGGQASTRQAKQRLGRILRRDGDVRAVLYEVVCEATREVERSRKRRRSDAYQGTRHRRL